MSPNPKSGDRLKRAIFRAIAVVGLPLLTLVLLEGGSSLLLYTRDTVGGIEDATRWGQQVRYDSSMGWEPRHSVYIPDMWGPGISYRTNAEGFRGRDDTPSQAPAGRARIICSGDSFTEGTGVDDDHTWCALLAAKDRHFESVNLGVLGYGFDQIYLRYKRDGYPLKPAVVIFAFIADDFRRMTSREEWYVGKPTLVVQNGTLTTENVPVPRWTPKLRLIFWPIQQLRAAQLIARLKAKSSWKTANSTDSDSAVAPVVSAIIRDLRAMSRANHSLLVLLYLPTFQADYLHVSPWPERIRRATEAEGNVLYLELASDLRRLPPDSALSMFIPLPGDYGHYTDLGNQWVADKVFQYLVGTPEIAAQLKPSG